METTNERRSKVIGQILKLMELTGENGAYEGEVLNALEQVKTLMDRYNVSEADILAAKKEEGGDVTGDWVFTKHWVTTGSNVSKWERFLAYGIQLITNTQVRVMRSSMFKTECSKRTNGLRMVFVGDAIDCAIAVALYTSLTKHGVYLSKQFDGKSSRTQYLMGYAERIQDRCKEMSKPVSTGTALVSTEKENWINEQLGKRQVVKQNKPTRVTDHKAYNKGVEEGGKVSLTTKDKLDESRMNQKALA